MLPYDLLISCAYLSNVAETRRDFRGMCLAPIAFTFPVVLLAVRKEDHDRKLDDLKLRNERLLYLSDQNLACLASLLIAH